MEDSVLHPAALPITRLLADCDVTRTRRSGPGGQHRNKVETAIVLRHRPTGIVAEANERRSQADNQRVAEFRLRRKLAVEFRLPTAAGSPPSPLWQSRSGNGRLFVNPEHEDFPALLAEALDRLAACDWNVGDAANQAGLSSSQFVRFLKLEPAALETLNRERVARGLHRLH